MFCISFQCRFLRLFCFYAVFPKKLDPLLFHHIFALAATIGMKISRST